MTRAVSARTGRIVCVKALRKRFRDDKAMTEQFTREGKIGVQLRHPCIVPIYEAGRDGSRHYIAMALIEGKSLADLVAEGPILFHRGAENGQISR